MRISDWSSDVGSSDLRYALEPQFLAHAVDQIAFIASRQAVSPRAEDHEGRRPRPRLRDIAQLDALTPRRRRRIILDRAFEPAVEPRGRHAVRPDFALLERGAHQRIDALARRARNGEHGHALDLDRKSTRLNSSH